MQDYERRRELWYFNLEQPTEQGNLRFPLRPLPLIMLT